MSKVKRRLSRDPVVAAGECAPSFETALVGRDGELRSAAAFLLREPSLAAFVWGAGGMGKTCLLRELERFARDHGRATCWLRLDCLEPSPRAVVAEACAQLGREAQRRLRDVLELADGAWVFVDALEAAPSLESFLIDELASARATTSRVVVASRSQPSPLWRDPRLRGRVLSLEAVALDDEHSRELLAQLCVPEAQRAAIVAFAHGHPLALALSAESPDVFATRSRPEQGAHRIKQLLDAIVERSLTREQREALECLVTVPTLSLRMLERLSPGPEPDAVFEWLRCRPYVRHGREGLVVHDMVREALRQELRWRDPERARDLSTRAVDEYCDQIDGATDARSDICMSLAWMLSHEPTVRDIFQGARGDLHVDLAQRNDLPDLRRMVERFDGVESREAIEALLHSWPQAFTVARDAHGRARGLWVELSFAVHQRPDLGIDPTLRRVAARLDELESLDGIVSVQRLQLDDETGREVGPTIALRVSHDARVFLEHPTLALRFLIAPTAFPWAKVWQRRGYVRLDPPVLLDAKSFSVWELDLRGTSPSTYVRAAFRGAGAVPRMALTRPEPAPPSVELRALREALSLLHSPLDFSRCELARSGALSTSSLAAHLVFRQEVEAALDRLPQTVAGNKGRRAIVATYLAATPRSQATIAEELGLPFRTYRDHLGKGLEWLHERIAFGRVGAERQSAEGTKLEAHKQRADA